MEKSSILNVFSTNYDFKSRDTSDGNLVNWSLSAWEEQGVDSREESMENICQKSETLDALLPRKFNMTGCINTCGKGRYL